MPAQAHILYQRVCGFEVTETGDTQKFHMCSPKNQEYFTAKEPDKTPEKDPTLAPATASFLCLRAAQQHYKEECQTLLHLLFFRSHA